MQPLSTRSIGLFASAFFAAAAAAQPDPLWIVQFGTPYADSGSTLALTDAGDVFIAGGIDECCFGEYEPFVARYTGTGERVWMDQFDTKNGTSVQSLALDGTGGLFVAGHTTKSLSGQNAGETDVFLVHSNARGVVDWIRQFGTPKYDFCYAALPDGVGGVYLAGRTNGDLGAQNPGGKDAFLARFDAQGEQVWLRQFGTIQDDSAHALASDGAGGAFVTGTTTGSLGGPFVGLEDVFIARYDAAGRQIWAIQFGTSAPDKALALAPDDAGGAFVAGMTQGDLAGKKGGGADAFLARYDGAGQRIFLKQFGTNAGESARALAPDSVGGVFVAGWTKGSLGGLNVNNGNDAFIARYDAAGSWLWIRQFGTSGGDHANALVPDGAGGAFVAGSAAGDLGGENEGSDDVFLARFGPGCYADCDSSGQLDIDDFLCFQSLFGFKVVAADCDQSGSLDVDDFICFQTAFARGCP